MIVVITSQANQAFAERRFPGAVFVSPMKRRAVHGASKVIIVGSAPRLERMYQGICPVEIVDPGTKPKTETITPEDDGD